MELRQSSATYEWAMMTVMLGSDSSQAINLRISLSVVCSRLIVPSHVAQGGCAFLILGANCTSLMTHRLCPSL